MVTKLSVYCDKVIEAGWLFAVILVPLFFNVYSSRVFEPDKLTLLRSIALIMTVAWLIKFLERVSWGESGQNDAGAASAETAGRGSSFRQWLMDTPMVLPALFMVLVYVVSTAASVVPGVSLLGSYQRLQGAYTTFSYLVVFFMILQGMRTREQLDRLVTVVLLSSLSISLYGMIQHDKLDPLPWGGDVTERVAANMGNAIFIAAYLIMATPLALGRVLETMGRIVGSDRSGKSVGFVVLYLVLVLGQLAVWVRFGFLAGIFSGLSLILIVIVASLFLDRPVAQFALLGAYSFILTSQLVTLLFSQSRGPWLGFFAGLYVFVLLTLTAFRRHADDQSRLSALEVGKAALFAALSPLLALAPAYVLMVVLRKGIRWLWLSWLLQASVGLMFLVVLNSPNTPLAPLRSLPYVGRLGDLLSQSGSGQVRVLIWEGAVEMLAPHEPLDYPSGAQDSLNSIRPVIGYGPESMYVAYNRFYRPQLAQIEARNASPDRSHNEAFDALITTGYLGFLAYLAVFGGVFYYGLKCLGLIGRARDRYVYVAAWVGGGVAGAWLAYLLDGSMRFFGVGFPLGCVAGLALYVALYGLVLYDPQSSDGMVDAGSRLITLALLAAVVAHYVEIHFGIAIAATRTHFWAYTAAIVAAGLLFGSRPAVRSPEGDAALRHIEHGEAVQPSRAPQHEKVAKKARSKSSGQKAAAEPGPPPAPFSGRATASLSVYALLVGLILVTMVYNFVTRNFDIRAGNYSIFWLFAVTWVLSSILVLALASGGDNNRQEATKDWARGLIVYLFISLGCLILFWLVYSWPLHADVTKQGIEAVMQIAAQVNTLLIVFYLTVGLLLLLVAWGLYRSETANGPAWQFRNWWIYPPLIVAVLWLILTSNIQVVLADMVYKQALPYDNRQEYDASIPLYLKAVELAPNQDFYFLFLGRAYLEKAQRTEDPQQKVALLAQSRDALLRALDINPLNTDHSANLARLYRAWGGLITEPAQRIRLLEESYKYYSQATSLSPNNAQLWNEWGLVAYFLGRYENAVEKFKRSNQLDPLFVDTYVFMGDAYQALNKPDEALQAHLEAIRLKPDSLSDPRLFSLPIPGFQERRLDFYAKSGKLDQLLAALGEKPQASGVVTGQEAPATDFETNSALGNIYLRQGQFDKALAHFNRAIAARADDLGSCVARGYIYSQQGKSEDALAEFQRCVQLAPNDLTSRRNLGGVLRQMGRNQEAIQEFEQAELLAPNDLLTIRNLADLYRLDGRLDDSLRKIERWVELAPDDYDSHRNLSLMYRDLGRIDEAITQAQMALSLAPEEQKPPLESYLSQLREQQKAAQ